jgi:two-component system CheB/CheR fusion protein
MAMVQQVQSAKYAGMPSSAMATGLADFVLPPAEMGGQLLVYIHRLPALAANNAVLPDGMDKVLPKIITLVRDRTGNDFSDYKEGTLLRRTTRRMALHQIDRPEDYLRFLQQRPEEITTLLKELLINVTSFFRDPPLLEF